ncbi:hypothetical protein [Novispirillum itersonii]|uniref:Uncharacterized protein n=1 Tax=Novispirillum itersonii TaxID=189 RepID=A0A7W9ZC36_NOVIT|nr:hypothetical protein [Novispirillum itersonii]MBB6208747.1 hypothetical protein [Novispirillum itersonii]
MFHPAGQQVAQARVGKDRAQFRHGSQRLKDPGDDRAARAAAQGQRIGAAGRIHIVHENGHRLLCRR